MSTIYYTPQEIAKKFKVSPQAVYVWVKEGKLKATKLGGRTIRISQENLDAFILAGESTVSVPSLIPSSVQP